MKFCRRRYGSRVRNRDWFGVIFLRLRGEAENVQGYWAGLAKLRGFLLGPEWGRATTGWYVNHIEREATVGAIRLSYFVRKDDAWPSKVLRIACTAFEVIQEEKPRRLKLSKGYDGREGRFRAFLATYSLVGLEMMASDFQGAWLFWEVFCEQKMTMKEPIW